MKPQLVSKPISNFLPDQYDRNAKCSVNHNYLFEQFSDFPVIFQKIAALVKRADYTLGREVDEFEKRFKQIVGSQFAVGVGSGTDALFLSLKAIGIKEGDEVITTPYTFYATIGAIVTAGGRPVFVDVGTDYNIDAEKIRQAITPQTKAILPVHWSGLTCDMDVILSIAREKRLHVVEDACHAINATYKGRGAGSFGTTGCFSMHPLKNLNVWGDGGVITTSDPAVFEELTLLRNHGLVNRNECKVFAYNSRLDTLQAIIANHLLSKLDHITKRRIENGEYFDDELRNISEITVPVRYCDRKQVFHIYVIRAERRDELQKYLEGHGVDAKVHYPIPMHLQPAARTFGYQRGDFPVAEAICDSVISLPVHEFVTREQCQFVVKTIKDFYR